MINIVDNGFFFIVADRIRWNLMQKFTRQLAYNLLFDLSAHGMSDYTKYSESSFIVQALSAFGKESINEVS